MNFPYLVRFQPVLLSLFRFITGLLLFQYGVAKLFKFPVLPYFANIPPLIYAAGTLELVLGALRTVGHRVRRVVTGEVDAPAFLLVVPTPVALLAAEGEHEHVVVDRESHRGREATDPK